MLFRSAMLNSRDIDRLRPDVAANCRAWLELCPCGMIHPNVLRDGGIDSNEYTGFAFGLGLTRLAMMKYGIKDIRDLNSGSLKTLAQFKY